MALRSERLFSAGADWGSAVLVPAPSNVTALETPDFFLDLVVKPRSFNYFTRTRSVVTVFHWFFHSFES